MIILCLYIPHLPIQWELMRHPGLAQSALIIGGFPHERKAVFDCSHKAAASGVYPGMTLRQASHCCPDAVFIPIDEAGYAKASEEVLDILDQFTPVAEAEDPGRIFLDVSGTERLFGPSESLAGQVIDEVTRTTGLRPQIGIASSRFIAGVAASLAVTSPLIVRIGQERTFLTPLSIEFLPIAPESIAWLKRLGLRTVGQVADLQVNALDSQLGQEGLMAHRLANGIDERPIIPRPRPDVLEETLSFEQTLESLDALLAALSRSLDRLVPLLRKRYQVCHQIRLSFRSDDGSAWLDTVTLKTPSDSQSEMLGILKRHLEPLSSPEGIAEIYLGLAKLGGEFGKQTLLSSKAKSQQEEALQRLEKDMGDRFVRSSLKKVVTLDPDSRIPERRVALADARIDG
ncbi:MAG: DNA polymerase Y family protein [Dehalococcoidia bacterium]|nr:DNA polymerase Y family protein [Dehalococcoidia bacterium]